MLENKKERRLFRALAAWAVACTRHSHACEISRKVSRGPNYYPTNIKNAEDHVDETHEKLSQAEGELLDAFSDCEELEEEK
jgi:hypothetical protein